jgi:hypothetical protein
MMAQPRVLLYLFAGAYLVDSKNLLSSTKVDVTQFITAFKFALSEQCPMLKLIECNTLQNCVLYSIIVERYASNTVYVI